MRQETYSKLMFTLALLTIINYIVIEVRFTIDIWGYLLDVTDNDIMFILNAYKLMIIEFFAMVLAAIALVRFRNKGLIYVMTICTLVIAIDCSLDAYEVFVDYRGEIEDEFYDFVLFIEGVISLVVAVMLFLNTVIYLRGLSKSANLIRYGILALLALQILVVIIELRNGESLMEIYEYRSESMPLMMMLILVLSMSSSKEVKQTSIMNTISASIRDMRNSMMAEGMGVDRSIAVKLSGYNEGGLWCESYSFILSSYGAGRFSMTLDPQSGQMVASVTSIENRSGMNNFRFILRGIWFDTGDASTCDLMRFYGTDGMFVQIIVRDARVHGSRKIPKIGSILLFSKEIGTRTYKLRFKITEMVRIIQDRIAGLKNKEEE